MQIEWLMQLLRCLDELLASLLIVAGKLYFATVYVLLHVNIILNYNVNSSCEKSINLGDVRKLHIEYQTYNQKKRNLEFWIIHVLFCVVAWKLPL